MTSRKDIINKYYASDIFNQNPSFVKGDVTPRPRLNRSDYLSTKEDIFNIKRESRIRRDNDPDLKPYMNRSVQKRRDNFDKMYASDIFFERNSRSTERRCRKKLIENNTNTSTFFERMKNNDEYVKDLKDYTEKHRGKILVDPSIYIKTITPQERYYTNFYENQSRGLLPGTTRNDQDKINYIKRKIHLHRDERIFNDVGADQKRTQGSVKEIRYLKRHPLTVYQKKDRKFVDVNEHPTNTCKINKQIQFESHIFNNYDNPYSKTVADIKEINDRIERTRNRHYHINILGQPFTETYNDKYDKYHKRVYYSLNKEERLRPATLDWQRIESEAMYGRDHSSYMFRKYGRRGPNAFQLKLFQYADSDNKDTLSGLEKKPYNYTLPKKQKEIDNETYEKIDEIVENIPNLNQGQKLTLKMKASVLDCANDKEWDDKARTLNNHYRLGTYLKKRNREVTGKIGHPDQDPRLNRTITERIEREGRLDRAEKLEEGENPDNTKRLDKNERQDDIVRAGRKERRERPNRAEIIERLYRPIKYFKKEKLEREIYDPRPKKEKNEPGFHNYVITYSKKGQNFGKFNDLEIKNMFGKKGIHVYDIHYSPLKNGNYNTISFKVMGNDNKNQITKRVKMVQEDLKKNNYKVNIEKGEQRNRKKNTRGFLNNSVENRGIFFDTSYNRSSRFKIMPEEYKKRKGFTKEFIGIDNKYKPNVE